MKKIVFLLMISGLFMACGNEKKEMAENLDVLASEAKEFQSGKPDFAKVDAYLTAIEEYQEKFPDDTLNRKYLYEAAQYSLTIEKPELCLTYLNSMIGKYGYVPGTSKALFLKAFVEENYIGNLEAAKNSYQAFIDNFPNEEKMVQDAQIAIDNLGIPADEMLQRILDKNKNLQDSVGS